MASTVVPVAAAMYPAISRAEIVAAKKVTPVMDTCSMFIQLIHGRVATSINNEGGHWERLTARGSKATEIATTVAGRCFVEKAISSK